MQMNTRYCQGLLVQVMIDVRKHTTKEQRLSVWVYDYGDGYYDVQSSGKDSLAGYKFWSGEADNKYHARYLFWGKWLEKRKHR